MSSSSTLVRQRQQIADNKNCLNEFCFALLPLRRPANSSSSSSSYFIYQMAFYFAAVYRIYHGRWNLNLLAEALSTSFVPFHAANIA